MDKSPKQSSNLLQSVVNRLSRLFHKGAESDRTESIEVRADVKTPEADEVSSSGLDVATVVEGKIVAKGSERKRRKKAATEDSRVSLASMKAEDIPVAIADFVKRQIADPYLGVESMADELQISRTGLYQLIHREFGVTPANYILDQRLKLAEELLRQGKTTRETSMKCGFSDPKYFSKVFKKHFGILPSAYNSSLNQQ